MTNSQIICFIDFETTGTNLFSDHPLQIGAILLNSNLKKNKTFCSLIRTPVGQRSTESAYKIHGIPFSDLVNAPTAELVLENFYNMFGTNYCFAGWNISFDVPFFKKLSYENGFQVQYDQINYRHIDVQSICATLRTLGLVNQNLYSLTDFVEYFKLSRKKKHDALEDATLTMKVYQKAVELIESLIK